jgi:hypothetical protein
MFRRQGPIEPLAEVIRRAHERWLDRAVAQCLPYPRIPRRRVDAGGYDAFLAAAGGRALADAWWARAFEIVDHVGRAYPSGGVEG